MIPVPVAVALAAAVVVLALHRPLLARLGVQYARQRPRQTALIVAGLMITTTVLAAAGIASDSSGASYREAVLGRIHFADAVVWSDTTLGGADIEGAIREHPKLRQSIERTSAGLRTRLPVDASETGLGESSATVWGIDPATFGAIALLEATDGRAPRDLASWGEGAVLVNRAMALQTGVAVGEGITIYVPRDEVDAVGTRAWNGTLKASVGVIPTLPEFHSPQDEYQWDLDVPDRTFLLELRLRSGSDADLVVRALGPSGTTHEFFAEPGEATFAIEGQQEPLGGLWNLSVHSPVAVDASFTLEAEWGYVSVLEPHVVEGAVAAVVHDRGSDPIGVGPAAFLPLPRLQEALGQPGAVNAVLIDLRADADDEAFDRDFQGAVMEVWSQQEDVFVPGAVTVPPRASFVRLELEQVGDAIESGMRLTFVSIGSFTIVAGLLLVSVLMALLVEERKRILATMRAIGASRANVTSVHVHEGTVYAVLASLAGLLAGGLLAAAMTSAARGTFDSEGASVVMVYRWGTVSVALATGFALTVSTIASAAWWTSRLPIAAALRDEAGDSRHGRVGAVVLFGLLLALGAFLSASALADGSALLLLLGPSLLVIGAAGVAARFVRRELVFPAAGAAILAYTVASARLFEPESIVDALAIPLRVVLLALASAFLAAYFAPLHRAVGWLLEHARAFKGVVAPAFAHMRHRPGRAALTMAILGTVLMVLTALGTLFSSFAPLDIANAGGYSVLADTYTPMDDPLAYLEAHPPRSGADPFRSADDWVATPWVAQGAGFELREGEWNASTFSMNFLFGEDAVGVTPAFAEASSWSARSLDPRFASARDALRAVARDPTLVVVSDGLLKSYSRGREGTDERPDQERVAVGDTLRPRMDPDGSPLRVIGVLSGVGTAGAFVHPDLLDVLSRSGEPGTRLWARPAPGVSDARLAEELEAGFRSAGVQASAVKDLQKDSQREMKTIQAVISVFLWLGIVIGLVALALVTTRNVLLRRQEVGVMRALGAQPWQVMASFGIETLYVVAVAIAIGFGGGLFLAKSVLADSAALLGVDWGGLAMLYVSTLLVALAAAAWPAWRASRIPVAEAVRHAE